MAQEYTEPKFKSEKFTCPRCGVYSEHQWMPFKTLYDWYSLDRDIKAHADGAKPTFDDSFFCQGYYDKVIKYIAEEDFLSYQKTINRTINTFYQSDHNFSLAELSGARCASCEKYSYWIDGKIIYPAAYTAPKPNPDMPEDCRKLYEEAQGIADKSPRAAAALLRLCLEVLLPHIGAEDKNINAAITNLVKEQKISPAVQQYLDICRVIGNQAVHAGELQINEEPQIARYLFDCLNMIVKEMISDPKARKEFYEKMPEKQRKAITLRDNKTLHKIK